MDETEEKTTIEEGKDSAPVRGEWNSKLEEAAQGIGQSAQGYKHMHIWQAQHATRRHKYLMGSGIVVGPLASVLTSVGLALNIENEPVISVLVILLTPTFSAINLSNISTAFVNNFTPMDQNLGNIL